MKKLPLLGFIFAMLNGSLQAAPNITVSGNSVTILGSAQTISLTCTLIDPNNTGNLRSGSNIITVFVTSTVTPGNVATCGPIYGNDVILDGFGNSNSTYYKVQVFTVTGGIVASTPSLQQFYAFTGSGTVDLSTATPLAPSFMTGTNGSVVVPGTLGVTGATSLTNLTVSGMGAFTGGLIANSINNVQMCDQFAGATADLKIAACIAALPAAGGVADARGIIGAQSFASTLVVNKTITLMLGATKITGPASGAMIDVQAQGVIIKGSGSMQNTGATQGTVLVPVTATQGDGIHFSATGGGNVQYKVSDLTINDSTAGGTTRTAGAGINADAAASPAQNSIGEVDNVYVSFMFTGIRLNRPITSTVLHATSVQSKQDDFDFQGDGTSTWCIQCYGNFSGRYNFAFFGLNYAGCIGCASDHAVSDGYHVARQSDTTGNQSISIFITNTGAETDSTGGGRAGVYALDVAGFYFSGKVLNAQGQGIWIDGDRTVTLSGSVSGSTTNDVNVTTSATPIIPGGVVLENLQYVTTGGGSFGTAVSNIGWNGSAQFFSTPWPFQFLENNAPSGLASADIIWGDPTAHRLKMNNNNGGAVTVPALETSDAWTGTEAFSGNTVALTADWTCGTGGTVASCVAATIIGSGGGVPLTFTLPLFARSYTLECDGVVGQATAATLNQWNLLTATNGATNVTANYSMATASTASAYGAVTDQAATTTTFQITPSWTLGGTATKMPFHIWAKIEGASASGTIVSLQLVAPTVADLVTIYRGTACRVF